MFIIHWWASCPSQMFVPNIFYSNQNNAKMEIDKFLESFSIVFNKDKTDYHTGETVQGQVRLTLFKPLKVYGVRLHIFGEAWTRWQEGRHTSTSDEKFIDKTITLWGNEDDDGETEKMYPDSYELPFAFVIPISCASSYLCGKSGAIEYSCRVCQYRCTDKCAYVHVCRNVNCTVM